MEALYGALLEDISCKRDEKVEAEDLLEETWFFGKKPSMISRCFSDPCSSTAISQEMFPMDSYPITGSHSVEEVARSDTNIVECYSIRTPLTLHVKAKHGVGRARKSAKDDQSPNEIILTAPSSPTCKLRDAVAEEDDESEFAMSKLIRQASFNSSRTLPQRNNLLQAPSLRPYIGREFDRKEENWFPSDELISQASLKPSELLPPRRHSSKGATYSCSISRAQMQEKPEPGGGYNSNDYWNKERIRFLRKNYKQTRKSLNDLEEKKRVDFEQDEIIRKPANNEESVMQRSATEWKQKSVEHRMKAQIKFWARAVASNVRQES